MSVHIEAKPGEIADKILLPGDPSEQNILRKLFWRILSAIIKFVGC